MDTDFLIEDKYIEDANVIYSGIADDNKRNILISKYVGQKIGSEFLEKELTDVDSDSSLSSIEEISEKYNFSDIYANGNYTEVCVYTEGELPCISKFNYDNKLLPCAYMFIKLAKNFLSAEVTGFVLPGNIDINHVNGDFYTVEEAEMVSFKDVEFAYAHNEEIFVDDKELYEFADEILSDEFDVIRKILTSRHARLKLKNIFRAKKLYKMISYNQAVNASENIDEFDNFSALLTEDNHGEMSMTDYAENTTFDYSTMTTPSYDLDALVEDNEEEIKEETENAEETAISEDFLEEYNQDSRNDDELARAINEPEDSYSEDALLDEYNENNLNNSDEKLEESESAEEIETLFNEAEAGYDTEYQENTAAEDNTFRKKKSNSLPLLIALLVILIAGAGYYGYTKYNSQSQELPQNNIPVQETAETSDVNQEISEAMPVESVSAENAEKTEEGTALSIPAIEKNLDASILVSNLKIDWEVPPGYISNTAAKRYLVKLGKIIQLNLKTELLLLSRPPITNKIVVELKYNENLRKFDVVGITVSSGESTVDKLILKTLDKTLETKFNINTDSFAKISGNPLFVIRL